MADVQALDMDIVTEKSGHSVVGMAVSVCLTPAAPSPLPMPYPLTASVSEGITDSPLRTKVAGTNCATIGSVLKTCHGNEPGTLKEVVSLNTSGPVAPITGAFTVLIELGPAAITGSICDMNKAPTPGAGSSASDAGGRAVVVGGAQGVRVRVEGLGGRARRGVVVEGAAAERRGRARRPRRRRRGSTARRRGRRRRRGCRPVSTRTIFETPRTRTPLR